MDSKEVISSLDNFKSIKIQFDTSISFRSIAYSLRTGLWFVKHGVLVMKFRDRRQAIKFFEHLKKRDPFNIPIVKTLENLKRR